MVLFFLSLFLDVHSVASAPRFPSLKHTFPSGFLSLSSLSADSYKSLIQLLPTAMRQLTEHFNNEDKIVATFESFSAIYHSLRSDMFSEEDLTALDDLIVQYGAPLILASNAQ